MSVQDVVFLPSKSSHKTTFQKNVVHAKASGPPHVIEL